MTFARTDDSDVIKMKSFGIHQIMSNNALTQMKENKKQ